MFLNLAGVVMVTLPPRWQSHTVTAYDAIFNLRAQWRKVWTLHVLNKHFTLVLLFNGIWVTYICHLWLG